MAGLFLLALTVTASQTSTLVSKNLQGTMTGVDLAKATLQEIEEIARSAGYFRYYAKETSYGLLMSKQARAILGLMSIVFRSYYEEEVTTSSEDETTKKVEEKIDKELVVGKFEKDPKRDCDPDDPEQVTLDYDKQLEHICGTKAYVNRLKQPDTKTSCFHTMEEARKYVRDTWFSGSRLSPNLRIKSYCPQVVGIGHYGEDQCRVRVSINKYCKIHGSPWRN